MKPVGLPAHATCSFSPASVALSGGIPRSTTITISTQGSTLAGFAPRLIGGATLALCLPVFGFLLCSRRIRRDWKPYAIVVLLLPAALFLAGCGSVSSNSGGGIQAAPPGTYTITVNATSASSPAIVHSQTIVFKVQ